MEEVEAIAVYGLLQAALIVTDDIDIYRSAKLYIDRHGDQAAIQVYLRPATRLFHQGRRHFSGRGFWWRRAWCSTHKLPAELALQPGALNDLPPTNPLVP